MSRHDRTRADTAHPSAPAAPRRAHHATGPAEHRRTWWGAAAGAVAGFLIGASVYLLVNPLLEGSGGWLEETQGLVWNVVPALTIVGAVVGHRVLRRRSRS